MAEQTRSQKLKRLVAVQRHLEQMAEYDLAETARQRVEVNQSMDNVIDVHIARLRRKVDSPFDRKLLKTVRGVGFVMNEHEACS